MKKTLALIMIAAIMLTVCACAYAGPKGKYEEPESGASITFNGKEAVFVDNNGTNTFSYTMDGETIVIELTNGRLIKFCTYSEEEDTVYLNIDDGSKVSFLKVDEETGGR